MSPADQFALVGLDIHDPTLWERGFAMLEAMMSDAEANSSRDQAAA